MIHAITKGKVSSQIANLEDVLTSCVFGLLKYLQPQDALIPFLKEAKNLNGASPFFKDSEIIHTHYCPVKKWRTDKS